ncbi:MAG: hypothetical protein M1536_07500 [Firmicutes bacterium]|nr:hypothetical protein [Bacillota bacterium]
MPLNPDFRYNLVIIGIIVGVIIVAAFVLIVRQRSMKPVAGKEEMVGLTGEARTDVDPKGEVFVHGELWRAVTKGDMIKRGEKIEVIAVKGLTLEVKKSIEEV